jgi:CPA2 family monovalent cation:H+ antiporter-2
VLSIAVATGSAVFFGASVALGAFLAGMVVAQSPVSQQAGADALPLRDAFAVLFFVSVGMLFDPRFVIEHPSLILGGLAIVLLVKPLAALAIVAAVGYPASTSLTVAVGLAQIGEFSFILGELAAKHGLIPEEGRHLLVACALVSITVNPLLFRMIGPAESRLRRMPRLWKILTARSSRGGAESNAGAISQIEVTSGPLAIIVGYGPVGRQMERLLRQAKLETVVIDLNMDTISFLKAQNRTAIFGDAASPEILEQAGATRASHIVISTTGIENRQSLIAAARSLNPQARVLVRTHYLREEAEACQAGANAAVVDEVESAVALAEMILTETGADAGKIREEARRVRHELSAPDRPTHA